MARKPRAFSLILPTCSVIARAPRRARSSSVRHQLELELGEQLQCDQALGLLELVEQLADLLVFALQDVVDLWLGHVRSP